jgi:hypothetical protein
MTVDEIGQLPSRLRIIRNIRNGEWLRTRERVRSRVFGNGGFKVHDFGPTDSYRLLLAPTATCQNSRKRPQRSRESDLLDQAKSWFERAAA